MSIKNVFFLLGLMLACIGLSFSIPMATAFYYGEAEVGGSFTLCLGISLILGILSYLFCRPPRGERVQLTGREGVAVVGLCWIFISVIGSIPFYQSTDVTFAKAFFETVSGFSTTGASIYSNVEVLPRGILVWRSLSQWVGGIGIIVFTLALLPFLGAGGIQLYRAEVTGITKSKVAPRMVDTARALGFICCGFTLILFILLMLEGLSPFDAFNHALSTMSTGGFSTKNASVGAFSPIVQWTVIIFMFIAGINMTLHFLFLTGNRKSYIKNEEFILYSLLLLVIGFMVSFLIYLGGFTGGETEYSPEQALRTGFFQVVSLGTGTGFATSNYVLWAPILQGIFVFCMLMGASTASTAGGIKVMRIIVIGRMLMNELRHLAHPRAVKRIKVNGVSIDDNALHGVACFFIAYAVACLFGGILVMATGQDFVTAFSAAISCISNVGPGLGEVGPMSNYSGISDTGLFILSFLMLVGRLEIFTIFLLFLPTFWRS